MCMYQHIGCVWGEIASRHPNVRARAYEKIIFSSQLSACSAFLSWLLTSGRIFCFCLFEDCIFLLPSVSAHWKLNQLAGLDILLEIRFTATCSKVF